MTASATREKFATQVGGTIVATLRELAQRKGRQIRALVDEALPHPAEKRRQCRPRGHLVAA